MLEQFLNHIEHNNLCGKDDRILLAVSGGLDSLVMAHLFQEAGFSFAIAHCNFQLRGEESDEDERFVKKQSEKLNASFYSVRFETTSYAKANDLSIQVAARQLRYNWFETVLNEGKYNVLATAHHLNDSIETILLNWINGSSLDGFSGIPVRNNKIIRPLLFATREAIRKYAVENKIEWREDSSNESGDYKRNFIRHNITPLLKELNPSLESTIQHGLKKLAGERELFDFAFNGWAEKYVRHTSDGIKIEKIAFDSFPHGASILWRLIKQFGFNFDVCLTILQSLYKQPGKKFEGKSHDLIIDRDFLIVFQKPGVWEDILIETGQQECHLGQWRMLIHESETKTKSPYEAVVDADTLSFPLRWRQWRAGDVFYPLGMEHRKKVSDLFIDEKVSLAEKSKITVLESGGQIVWVVGQRMDNRFKITDHTRRVMAFSVSPHFV